MFAVAISTTLRVIWEWLYFMGVLEDGQDKREWSCNSILCCIDYCKFIGLNKITGCMDSWVVWQIGWINVSVCIWEWMCVCGFIVLWECAKWLWLLMSVWMWVIVCVINWTLGMGTSAEKIHYFLQIYITSRNTLKFTWLLIIHRRGICPGWVSQKLVKSDVILIVITAASSSGHMPQVQVKSRSMIAHYRERTRSIES